MLQTCRSKCKDMSAKSCPDGGGGRKCGQWRRIGSSPGYWVLRTSPPHLPGAPIILRLGKHNEKGMLQCIHTASYAPAHWFSPLLILEVSIGCMCEMPKRSQSEILHIRGTTRDAEVFKSPQRGPIHDGPLACVLRA